MDKQNLVEFVLKLAQFESQFEAMIRKLVTSKTKIWEDDREAAVEYLTDISRYFSGELNWDKGEPEESYAIWFKEMADSCAELDVKRSSKAGAKIQNIVKALD